MVDVAVVGAGPAGLASAIACAQAGASVVVLERRHFPPDKACGEGLLPPAVRALEALGARRFLDGGECSRLDGIRYVQEDGCVAEARLPGEGGLVVRRPALVTALRRRAEEVGVKVQDDVRVHHHERTRDAVRLHASTGPLDARLLVGADGLASPIRRREGLDRAVSGPHRFGLRQHFRAEAWTSFVEVHFADDAEAYVSAAGAGRVVVIFLWERERLVHAPSVEAFLPRFPALERKLSGAEQASRPLGAGPLRRRARSAVADRVALVGDAAGYVDAVTGEGICFALESATALGLEVREALRRGASRAALAGYEREQAKLARRYTVSTNLVLAVARRPWARRRAIHYLARNPRAFESLLAWAVG